MGTIHPPLVSQRQKAVHPHGRGDNPVAVITDKRASGSPPRAWGQSTAPPHAQTGVRFTPTGVGTIPSSASDCSRSAVHPHGRGDNAARLTARMCASGSPPRAWGQWHVNGVNWCRIRFTPTGVGTIMDGRVYVSGDSVHPHGRGDNTCTGMTCRAMTGSPPRAWGQCSGCAVTVNSKRFTPTGVGTMASRAAAQ